MIRRSTAGKRRSNAENEEDSDDVDFVPRKSTRRNSSKSEKSLPSSPKPSVIEPAFKDKLASILKGTTNRNKCPPSRNILSAINRAQGGLLRDEEESIEESARRSVVASLRRFEVYKTSSPFEKRVTAITWHPTQPSLFAVGNKWGSIVLWNHEKRTFNRFLKPLGPGCSIQNIKFHPEQPDWVYTCSIDGTMTLKNMATLSNLRVFQSTESYHFWYTAFDVSFQNKLLLCGNNKGRMTLMTSGGEETVWSERVHKGKIHDIRFSPRVPWLLVSTSTDHSVKIWDVRNLKSKVPLSHIPHNNAVNSAVFSSVDGGRILTTDQHSELRIYKAPQWSLQRVIPHPHRQFQHLSPIIATWHPLVDLIVVGRYPDSRFEGYVEGEARSIDLIDPDKGTLEFQMSTPIDNRIASLNQFSPSGEALLSCAAGTINVWKSALQREEDCSNEKVDSGTGYKIESWPTQSETKARQKTKSKKVPPSKKAQ